MHDILSEPLATVLNTVSLRHTTGIGRHHARLLAAALLVSIPLAFGTTRSSLAWTLLCAWTAAVRTLAAHAAATTS